MTPLNRHRTENNIYSDSFTCLQCELDYASVSLSQLNVWIITHLCLMVQ